MESSKTHSVRSQTPLESPKTLWQSSITRWSQLKCHRGLLCGVHHNAIREVSDYANVNQNAFRKVSDPLIVTWNAIGEVSDPAVVHQNAT